eukprot:1853427-Prymnesium_polylepis.1
MLSHSLCEVIRSRECIPPLLTLHVRAGRIEAGDGGATQAGRPYDRTLPQRLYTVSLQRCEQKCSQYGHHAAAISPGT